MIEWSGRRITGKIILSYQYQLGEYGEGGDGLKMRAMSNCFLHKSTRRMILQVETALRSKQTLSYILVGPKRTVFWKVNRVRCAVMRQFVLCHSSLDTIKVQGI